MSVGLQRLRDEPDVIRDGAVRKGEDPALVDRALELDAERRRLLGESETLKAERNAASKRIGEAIRAGAAPDGPEVAGLRDASTAAGERITTLDATLAETQAELDDLLLRIPNPPDADIPVGGEEANVTIRTLGRDPRPRGGRARARSGRTPRPTAPPGRAGRTGSSATRSASSTTSAARRSPAPASRSTRAPAPRSSAASSTGSSTSTPASTASPRSGRRPS